MAARKRGEEAVPVRIDHLAASEPHKICFSIPNCRTDPSQGWRDISFRDFANAANHAAHYLSKTLGGQSDKLDCIAYVGPNDVRYDAPEQGSAMYLWLTRRGQVIPFWLSVR